MTTKMSKSKEPEVSVGSKTDIPVAPINMVSPHGGDDLAKKKIRSKSVQSEGSFNKQKRKSETSFKFGTEESTTKPGSVSITSSVAPQVESLPVDDISAKQRKLSRRKSKLLGGVVILILVLLVLLVIFFYVTKQHFKTTHQACEDFSNEIIPYLRKKGLLNTTKPAHTTVVDIKAFHIVLNFVFVTSNVLADELAIKTQAQPLVFNITFGSSKYAVSNSGLVLMKLDNCIITLTIKVDKATGAIHLVNLVIKREGTVSVEDAFDVKVDSRTELENRLKDDAFIIPMLTDLLKTILAPLIRSLPPEFAATQCYAYLLEQAQYTKPS